MKYFLAAPGFQTKCKFQQLRGIHRTLPREGDKDFLAMSFWSPDSIGLFSFAGDRLQKLETINLDFSPSQILWIPCYATLFVSRLGNSKGFTAVSFQNIRNLSPSPVEFIDIISQEVEIESWAIVSIKSEDLSKLG